MDATPVISGRTGIAFFVTELAHALRRHDVEPQLFAVGCALAPVPAGCRRVRLPSRLVHRSWAWGGPPRVERLVPTAQVVHATSLLPPTTRLPIVATVHDLAALERPDLHPARLVAQTSQLVRHLHRASVITTVSSATAASLRARGFDADRVIVTLPGVVGLGPPRPERIVQAPYLLAVGEQLPRKGLDVLLEAFAAADLGGVELVHAGPPSTDTTRLRTLVDFLHLDGRVHFLGYVGRDELATLFRDAVALCFPSWDEGFGLPVLEALSLAVPVVASDIDACREVAGDGALFAPPGDVAAWTSAVQRIVADEALRTDLRARGPARAARFSWDECAVATIAAYERAMADR
jgi:glycosyltransferase involved in cell wall biosynthesis